MEVAVLRRADQRDPFCVHHGADVSQGLADGCDGFISGDQPRGNLRQDLLDAKPL